MNGYTFKYVLYICSKNFAKLRETSHFFSWRLRFPNFIEVQDGETDNNGSFSSLSLENVWWHIIIGLLFDSIFYLIYNIKIWTNRHRGKCLKNHLYIIKMSRFKPFSTEGCCLIECSVLFRTTTKYKNYFLLIFGIYPTDRSSFG